MATKGMKCCCPGGTGSSCCFPEICWNVEFTWETVSGPTTTHTETVLLRPVRSSGPCTWYGFVSPWDLATCDGGFLQLYDYNLSMSLVLISDTFPPGYVLVRWTDAPTPYTGSGTTCGPGFLDCVAWYTMPESHEFGTVCNEEIVLTLDTDTLALNQYCEVPPSTLTLVPAPDCDEVFSLNCPLCVSFTVSGVTDGAGSECTECEDMNGTHHLNRSIGACSFTGAPINDGYCVAFFSADYVEWVLVYDEGTTTWTLSLVAFDSFLGALGSIVVYTIVDDSPLFPKDFSLDSAADGCDNWPATLTLTICPADPTYGACCQTVGSVGISMCGESPEAECAAIGGSYLGQNTTCYREGCVECTYPSECILISNSHTFIDITVTGTTGICAADETVTVTHTSGCEWTGPGVVGPDSFLYVLDVIGGAAGRAPEWRLTITILDGLGNPNTVVFSTNAFCDLVNIPLAFVSESFTGDCPATSYATAAITLDLS